MSNTHTRVVYNKQGKVFTSTDGYLRVTTSVYDFTGNLVETIAPDGTVARSVYDQSGRVLFVQDRARPDGAGVTTGPAARNTYDAAGRVMISAEVPGSPYCSQLYFRVERVDGDATGVLDFYSDGYGRGQSGPATLPMTGRYTVYVRYNCGYYGEYRLRVTLVRPPVQMESEENGALDRPTQTAAASCGSWRSSPRTRTRWRRWRPKCSRRSLPAGRSPTR